jgi:hypothetical protein
MTDRSVINIYTRTKYVNTAVVFLNLSLLLTPQAPLDILSLPTAQHILSRFYILAPCRLEQRQRLFNRISIRQHNTPSEAAPHHEAAAEPNRREVGFPKHVHCRLRQMLDARCSMIDAGPKRNCLSQYPVTSIQYLLVLPP